jgi:hypothetical protein
VAVCCDEVCTHDPSGDLPYNRLASEILPVRMSKMSTPSIVTNGYAPCWMISLVRTTF